MSFAETMFKRPWWQGYKGHFAAFRWDTLYSTSDLDSGQFNRSENRAWVYGAALKSWAQSLSNSGYTVSILGHSMGNVVCGEALRRGLKVEDYLLMQAAVAASCYNPNVATEQRFTDAEAHYLTPGWHADPNTHELTLGYCGYLQNVADRLVNFYNPQDFALQTGFTVKFGVNFETNWVKNQIDYKPDGNYFGASWTYSYVTQTIIGGQPIPLAQRAKLDTTAGWQRRTNTLAQISLPDGVNADFHSLNASGIISSIGTLTTGTNASASTSAKKAILLLPVEMMVDGNRDGKMSFTEAAIHDKDGTTAEKPYRFWLNNDHDKGGAVDGSDWEEDDYNDGQHDFDKGTIDWKRDLEDFTRLWITFKGLTEMVKQPGFQLQLEWKPMDGGTSWPTADGNPAIKLYKAVESDGGKKYVEEDTWAAQQLTAPYNATLGQVGKGAPLILPLSQVTLTNLTETNPNLYLLFEGVTEGKGRLVLNLIKGGQKIGEYPPLYLDIKPIKKMYERWSVGNVGAAGVNYNIWPASSPGRVGDALPAPTTDAEKDYILLVHGWNMQEWEKENYAETAFKRLWHLGYKGRFGLYEWPTFYFTGFAPSLDNFDASEERAWNSAPGLLNLIGQLNQTAAGRVRLLAHSMGNVVAGEALRLADRQRVVHTYVASQAAIAAHCYDATVPAMSFSALIAGPSTPNCYAHYWQTGLSSFPGDWLANTPSYLDPQYTQGAAGSFVNYFNPVDYALTSIFGWETDQQTKPNYHYDYAPSGSDRGFIYRPVNPFNNRNLRFPADTREIFSYADEAQSHALGSQTGVGGVFGGQIDLQSKFSFGSQHKYHSGQFRSTNMLRRGYWKQLLESYSLESNP